jgi:hypothetical protein
MIAEKIRALRVARVVVIVALFGSFFLSYARVPVWDYDFWWHLATGRYIVTEKHLPDKDPFSLTSNLAENKNPFPEVENLILKQYWLAQSLFYLIYAYAGFQGIIILRSILLFLTLFVVYRHMSRSGVNFFISLILTFCLFEMSLKYQGERPVLFTILFTAIVFSILDGYTMSRGKKIFFLIPLMLLWANLHGGFIIGDIFLLTYMFGETVRIFLKRSDLSTTEKKLFFGVATAAIVASLINPTGVEAFSMAFSPKYAVLKETIQEWQSPYYIITHHIYAASGYYSYFAVLALFALLLLVRNRRMDINHILLVSALWYESTVSMRLIMYFMIPAVIVIGRESSAVLQEARGKRWPEPTVRKVEYVLTLATVCVVSFFMFGRLQKGEMIAHGIDRSTSPERAVDFIEQNRVQGNLFNEYCYGGYIAWRLYPWKKNFIDTRALNIIVMKENNFILSGKRIDGAGAGDSHKEDVGLFEKLLDHYKIDILLFSQTQLYGDITPLILNLMDGDQWVPVFCDPISVVYLRNIPENETLIRKFRITNDNIYNSIIFRSSSTALKNKTNPRPLLAMGEVFHRMGRLEDSLKAYQYAAKRDPNNAVAREKIGEVQSEMRQKRI